MMFDWQSITQLIESYEFREFDQSSLTLNYSLSKGGKCKETLV